MEKRSHKSVLDMIDNLLEQADHVKQASNLDLASDSKSTHPSANVDDKTKPATEGARSAENKSDVQKEVPDNVEEAASKNTPGDSENAADTMGTQSMAADETKGNVATPKKDHSQSMADSGPGDGKESFKGDWDKASADQLVSGANSLLEQLSTSLGVKSAKEVEIEMKPGKKPKVEVENESEDEDEDEDEKEGKKASDDVAGMYKAAAEKYPDDEEAGYVAASMLIDFLTDEKQASEQYSQTVDGIQKQASADAESYVSFLRGYEESVKEAQPMMAADPSMAAGPEAAMGGAGGGDMGGEAALAALAGAAGGAGGEEGGEEGTDDEAIIEAIAEALDEAGVTPEELAQAVAEAEGEAPEAGEGEPEAEGEMEPEQPGETEPEPKMSSNKSKRGQVKKASSKDALRAAVQKIVRGQ